jgi:hypothetical protein
MPIAARDALFGDSDLHDFLTSMAPMTTLAQINIGGYLGSSEFLAVLANLLTSIFSAFASSFYSGIIGQ